MTPHEEERIIRELEIQAADLKNDLEDEVKARKDLEAMLARMSSDKLELEIEFNACQENVKNFEEKNDSLLRFKVDLDSQLKLLREQLEDEKERVATHIYY